MSLKNNGTLCDNLKFGKKHSCNRKLQECIFILKYLNLIRKHINALFGHKERNPLQFNLY
jgi:hypothetical protein